MVALLRTFVALSLSAFALAAPTPVKTPDLFKRTISGAQGATCGGNQFTAANVEAAAAAAASHIANNSQIGRNKYPHKFNNREGFTFQSDCNAPFFEFPIFKSQVYTGGSPGPDRVVIGSVNGEDAAFCGLITHTGAAGRNGFLQCQAA
ncbi:unnamed protein product [Rhizoctonia solani]|uniref:Uncharacterized protein n=1 Tax=Rhizoctonia solani TaxID=456999 RepID=A0A8H3E2M2_9AGAM|nr:unnamed protein product [Rhizoctonia solani]